MSNLSDVIGGSDLFGGSSYSFTCDRFGLVNSAIYFNKGYLNVTSGVYFSGDFTFTAWIYLKSYQSNSRIFDFGNGEKSDNVFIRINTPFFSLNGYTFNGTSQSQIDALSIINLNEWYFISFVLNGTNGYIYVNGNQVGSGTLKIPNNITRTTNYIGKSNWGNPNADAIYDEFKIYQGALSSNEIMNEYQLNSNGKIINYCPSNYWPMSNLSDIVGGANLYGGVNYSFTYDRFCSADSAIYFNSGYLQVPAGFYFSGDFTFTAWIYLKSYQYFSRIFDFDNGKSNNVLLGMAGINSQMCGIIFNGTSHKTIQTLSIMNLNEWYFISFVLSGTTGFIYVNGSQAITGTLNVPNKILRKSNYIGKSNLATDSNADAIYDELKLYQGALSSNDIMNEYQKSSNNSKLKSCLYYFYYLYIFNFKR
jgi:hypothetical protein